MQYFKKNVELASLYGVSESAVRNWIEAAREGRLNLQLHEQAGRFYITNSPQNRLTMQQQAKQGKKYRNAAHHKVITPSSEFYKLYSVTQVADMVSELDIYREIPLKYSYFDGGAEMWDQHVQKLVDGPALDYWTFTNKLMTLHRDYISDFLEDSKRVNIVDLGAGNAMPDKVLMTHLVEKGILGRYIGIDLSESMLDITRRNLNSWFGDQVAVETHVLDINTQRFNDLLVDESFSHSVDNPVNIVLLLGGTIANFRSPAQALDVIRSSMGRNDLLIYTNRLSTSSSRPYFDFGPNIERLEQLSPRHRLVLDLLGIDETCYDVEQIFDEKRQERSIRARLKVSLSLRFELHGGERTIDINKGESLLVWRGGQEQDAFGYIQQLNDSGFRIINSSTTKDNEYFLAIAGIKASR